MDFGTDQVSILELLGLINETYKLGNIKNMTRQERGTSCSEFNITGFEQNMPQGKPGKTFRTTVNKKID